MYSKFVFFRQVLGLGKRIPPQELYESLGKTPHWLRKRFFRFPKFLFYFIASYCPFQQIVALKCSYCFQNENWIAICHRKFLLTIFKNCIFSVLDAVTSEDLRRISEEMLATKPSMAAIGNCTNLPDLTYVQDRLHKRTRGSWAASIFN